MELTLQFTADAHRDDGKRFVVHADEKLPAFVELQLALAGMEIRPENLRQHYAAKSNKE
jgi:hypothetical protein